MNVATTEAPNPFAPPTAIAEPSINPIDLVAAFHAKFKVPKKFTDLRARVIAEELTELNQALDADDRREILDGILDVIYVTAGTCVVLGIPKFERSQAYNDVLHQLPTIKGELSILRAQAGVFLTTSPQQFSYTAAKDYLNNLYQFCLFLAKELGMEVDDNFMIVHNNNMAKVWPVLDATKYVDSKVDEGYTMEETTGGMAIVRDAGGKVIKPRGHTKPALNV